MTRTAAGVFAASVLLTGAEPASAHRLDEYLQAMRVDVRRDAIALELDLRPGVALAPEILAALDPNGDGAIESSDRDLYVSDVAQHLRVTIDGRRSALTLTHLDFPSPDALRAGTGAVRLVFDAESSGATGAHQVVVDNAYRSDASVYLANALRPDSEVVTISSQRRDPLQRSLTIDYVVGGGLLTLASASWTGAALLLIGLTAYSRRRQPVGGAADL